LFLGLSVIVTLSSEIERLEKRLQESLGPRPEYDLLTSVPGIGRILAAVILLETGNIDWFEAVGRFAS
jgi:transposase